MKAITVEGHTFICSTGTEAWRAKTLLTKEKGTIKWLQQEAYAGRVFYDIGANIGLYTIVAAKLGATVYAFEPHIPNAHSLLRNIEANNLQSNVKVITSALHSEDKFLDFNYMSLESGSSGHQLGHTTSENGKPFLPETTELKHATTIDLLVQSKVIPLADIIKIDVDGNEKKILKGMGWLLATQPPPQVQVEIHPTTRKDIIKIMDGHGYPLELAGRHDTLHGKVLMADGLGPEMIAYNVIFRHKQA